MVRSSGFGSTTCYYTRPLQTRFRFGSGTLYLNLATHRNSPARSTKSTRSRLTEVVALSLLVSIRFQVLFHSPPGVLFTVPSRYFTLSVTWSYLALRDGPRLFRLDSSCPVVLRILPPLEQFHIPGFYRLRQGFPTLFYYRSQWILESFTPEILLLQVWALPISLATTFGIVFTFFSSG